MFHCDDELIEFGGYLQMYRVEGVGCLQASQKHIQNSIILDDATFFRISSSLQKAFRGLFSNDDHYMCAYTLAVIEPAGNVASHDATWRNFSRCELLQSDDVTRSESRADSYTGDPDVQNEFLTTAKWRLNLPKRIFR